MMPALGGLGLLVAGDAAAFCLAAGMWLEGVNFAMGSGMTAGRVVDEAMKAGKLKSGDHAVFVAFGGGLTWANAVLRV